MKQQQKCEAVCGSSVCQLEAGHRRKHREDGVSWTDAGAKRLEEEANKSTNKIR